MAKDFEELGRGAATLFGDAHGIWVMVLFGKPTKADMLLARPALAAMAERAPSGFPTLTWVLPEAGLSMDNDARTAAAEVTNEFRKEILAEATVIELGGFQGATVRAIVSGLEMMAWSRRPKKVFGELELAVDWSARKTPSPATLDRVQSITRALGAARVALVPSS